ncbi:MAG: hypothetical protein ACRD6X_15975 [Pyrinomonadaceae bacterium]
MMTITIDLPTEIEARVKSQASAERLRVEDYLSELIGDAANRRERIRKAAEKSFAEILAPIQKGFAESGMSEEEILDFFEEIREEVWQEQNAAK